MSLVSKFWCRVLWHNWSAAQDDFITGRMYKVCLDCGTVKELN